ncbi:MAG: MOSC domain-containing protein [Cytophagaceae bacterium BCCC1]|nr:MAG: MOSC domain-containing protein [Cytophagaceae bacterium BCCC1]
MEISKLFIYPIKSLGGISLQKSEVEMRGLKHDRRWMLVDDKGLFLTQRNLPKLAAFSLSINDQFLGVLNKITQSKINIPFLPKSGIKMLVKVWDDELMAEIVDKDISDWFSQQLGQEVNLVYQSEESIRMIDYNYAVNGEEHTSFSDGYPILIISEASLEELNSKCPEKIPMERFRPNIVIKNCDAFFEDKLKEIKIGGTVLYGVKPCARCIMTTINQETFEKSKEPILTLSKFRKFENRILFGQNVVVHKTGDLAVGDKVV